MDSTETAFWIAICNPTVSIFFILSDMNQWSNSLFTITGQDAFP